MDEVLLQVPLVVRYPAALGVEAGVDPRPTALVDLAPTVLSVAGAKAVGGSPLHGLSLLDPPDAAASRVLFADYQLNGDELSAARVGDHKLVVNWSRDERHLIEPGEFPATVPESRWRVRKPLLQTSLEEAFDTYVTDAESFSADVESEVEIDSEELEERLRAIGYFE